MVCSFRRANLAIDIVLRNNVACPQEDYRRLECYIEAAGNRVYQAETPRAREECLLAQFDLILQLEHLWAALERARQRVDEFRASYADVETFDVDNVAYEVLKTEIAGYLHH